MTFPKPPPGQRCTTCNGAGVVGANMDRCFVCKGSGRAADMQESILNAPSGPKVQPIDPDDLYAAETAAAFNRRVKGLFDGAPAETAKPKPEPRVIRRDVLQPDTDQTGTQFDLQNALMTLPVDKEGDFPEIVGNALDLYRRLSVQVHEIVVGDIDEWIKWGHIDVPLHIYKRVVYTQDKFKLIVREREE